MTTYIYNAEYGDAPEEGTPDGTLAGTFDGTAQQQILVGESGSAEVSVRNFLCGEALGLTGSSRRGNDVLTGGDNAENTLYGEASTMDASQGGNDVLTGGTGASSTNYLYGEASAMDASQGGNDVLTGGAGSNVNYLFGDADDMRTSRGGNDQLTGGDDSFNYLYGDAFQIRNSRGGNDVLIAGDDVDSDEYVTQNKLYGDAYRAFQTEDHVICGNDRLVSGTGTDDMWGDFAEVTDSNYQPVAPDPTLVTTGHDVFVFSENNGQDTIYDFHRGEDKIELQGIDGVASFGALQSGGYLEEIGTDTVITFGTNIITILGVIGLTVEDFLFT